MQGFDSFSVNARVFSTENATQWGSCSNALRFLLRENSALPIPRSTLQSNARLSKAQPEGCGVSAVVPIIHEVSKIN
jgi:hypothetical protein